MSNGVVAEKTGVLLTGKYVVDGQPHGWYNYQEFESYNSFRAALFDQLAISIFQRNGGVVVEAFEVAILNLD